MNAKEHFTQVSQTEAFINIKKQHLVVLKDLAYTVGAPNLSGMPKNPCKSPSPMADAVCRALDLEAEIQDNECQLRKKKVLLLELIGTIDSCDCQTLLINRYFEHLSWNDIANRMFYSTRWIYKLHGRALEELDKKLNERSILP